MAHRTSDEAAVSDAPYVFSEIRSALLDGKRPPGAWLQKLSDEEWLALASDLERQTDDAGALRYLRLFAARRFPGDPEQLLPWLNSSDSRTAWAAVRALGQIRDPRVRKLALERLREGDSTGLRLLKTNYEPGDLETITPLLSGAEDDDKAHDLGLGILDLIGENEVPLDEKRGALLLLYERTPCSMCRADAVTKLVSTGQAPSFIADECRFDADPDTAKLFDDQASAGPRVSELH
jgi:HEAT repeat protein